MSYYDLLDWIDIEITNYLNQIRICRKLHTVDTPMEMERSLAIMTALTQEIIERDSS